MTVHLSQHSDYRNMSFSRERSDRNYTDWQSTPAIEPLWKSYAAGVALVGFMVAVFWWMGAFQ